MLIGLDLKETEDPVSLVEPSRQVNLNISPPNLELEKCVKCLYLLTERLVLHFFSIDSMSSRSRKASSSYNATRFTDLFAVLPVVSSQSISCEESDKAFIALLLQGSNSVRQSVRFCYYNSCLMT